MDEEKINGTAAPDEAGDDEEKIMDNDDDEENEKAKRKAEKAAKKARKAEKEAKKSAVRQEEDEDDAADEDEKKDEVEEDEIFYGAPDDHAWTDTSHAIKDAENNKDDGPDMSVSSARLLYAHILHCIICAATHIFTMDSFSMTRTGRN